MRPFQLENKQWHDAWVKNGRPRNGNVYENMKKARKDYMYAVRRNKKLEWSVRYEKMASAVAQNKARDFFMEIKKMNSGSTTPPNINGKTDHKEITDHFADKYDRLLNSTGDTDMRAINQHVSVEILAAGVIESIQSIDGTMIEKIVRKMKKDKNDGDKGLNSSHLHIGGHALYNSIAGLCRAVLIHGHQPEGVLMGTICSIPKDLRGDLCADSNYRGITLNSPIGKVMDLLFLERNSEMLHTSDAQFAFKAGRSTSMCTVLVKEVVKYYSQRG